MADVYQQASVSTENADVEAEAADRLMSFASLVQQKSSARPDDANQGQPSATFSTRTLETPDDQRSGHIDHFDFSASVLNTDRTNGGNETRSQKTTIKGSEEASQESFAGTTEKRMPGQGQSKSSETPSPSPPPLPSSEATSELDVKDASQRSYFVKHDYRDHADVRIEELSPVEAAIPATQRSNRGGVKMLFPEKLHQLLSMSPEIVDPAIISWSPHGRCFSVHNTREFTRELMPKYFNHNAITSFQRQLNLYGFKRITKAGSKDQGAYYHELFLRGRPALCRRMRRQKIKGTGYKPLPDPENEPDFYAMPSCWDVLDDSERKEQFLQQKCLDRSPSPPPTYVPMKREMEGSDIKAESDQKLARMGSEGEWNAYDARSELMARAVEEASLNSARRLSLLGAMQHNPRRISLPERVNYGVPSLLVGAAVGRRGSLPLSSGRDTRLSAASIRETNGRFADPIGRILTQRDPSPKASVNGATGRESLIQELIARARSGSEVTGGMGHAAMPQDAVIRNEIDMLEHTRRNIVMQQERLQMLMDQVHSSRRSSLGMGRDFSSGVGLGGMRDLGRLSELERRSSLAGGNIGQLERRASLLASGRIPMVEPRRSMGGLDTSFANSSRPTSLGGLGALGIAGFPPKTDASGGCIENRAEVDGRDGSTSAVYNSLASMVSSGRFTNAQLDEIELMLKAGRNQAAADQGRNGRDRNT